MTPKKWFGLAGVMTILFFVIFVLMVRPTPPTTITNLIGFFMVYGCFSLIGGTGVTLGIYLRLKRWEQWREKEDDRR
ncbi:MAG: hypothetical protein GY796_21465 [Chloroflexi bacterium]|nr:hypothetical protein [Chloroflexota bacterium]